MQGLGWEWRMAEYILSIVGEASHTLAASLGGGGSPSGHVVGSLLQRWLPTPPLQEQVGLEGLVGLGGQGRLPRGAELERGEQVHLGAGRMWEER